MLTERLPDARTPSSVRIDIAGTLEGVNMRISRGPNAADPLGQREDVTAHSSLGMAILAIPARIDLLLAASRELEL